MPLTKVPFKAGVLKDESPLAAEGAWTDADKVRFVNGLPQTIGGWEQVYATTHTGVARGGHAWATLEGKRYFVWGTASNLYVSDGTTQTDITPRGTELFDTFDVTVTNGSPSVLVSNGPDTDDVITGDVITITSASSTIGGLSLNGTWTVLAGGSGTFSFNHTSNASSSDSATRSFRYSVPFRAGLTDGVAPSGNTEYRPRIWSLDNFGERLLAVPRGGALYEWNPSPTTILTDTFGSSAGWTLGAGWAIAAGTLNASGASSSTASKNVNLPVAGESYRVTFTVTNMTTGQVIFQDNGGVSLGTHTSSPIRANGTYSSTFVAPVGFTGIQFSKSGSFDGSIDNLTITTDTKAYPITTAPTQNDTMYVDENRIVHLLGTQDLDGTYYPMLDRWSDIEDARDWTPSSSDLSGTIPLAKGSRIVGGLVSRRQNLMWSDEALFAQTFLGDSQNVYSTQLIETGCGLIGANAATSYGGVAYWMGRRNFYAYNGAGVQVIPCSATRDVFDNLAANQEEKVFCGLNRQFNEIWWFYPDSRDGTECSRYVAINVMDGTTTVGTLGRTTWIPDGVFPYPIGLGTDNKAHYHEKGLTANGSALTPSVTSGYFDIGDGEFLAILKAIWPDFDDQVGDVLFTVSTKRHQNGTETNWGPYTAATTTEAMRMRIEARQIKLRIHSTATSCFWRLGALRLDLSPSGARR